jgi:3-deoxy-D-manno-octulosonic-acid transferase
MARLLYTAVVLALLPGAVLHLLWRARRQPAYLRHWGERFGLTFPRASKAPVIWLHAVSVGETRAAQPLVAALRARYPDHRILLTHMTPTGKQTSETLFGDGVERCYLPYDTPWAARRFLRHFRPVIGLILETELWPNLIAACGVENVPLLLVNARLSERSARRYARLPNLSRSAVRGLAAVSAIGAGDAGRLQQLGAQNVAVFGSMKFDIAPPEEQIALGAAFRRQFGARRVFLCASTRDGEEALVLAAWRRRTTDGALLVLVPRHPQRFDTVAALAESHGFKVERRSARSGELATNTEVWLGDSMGEMFAYYAAADVAFIGGSLLNYGSQNLIEACAVGTPVLIGPSTFNFPDVAREALACGAGKPVRDADDLVASALALLADAPARTAMAEAGKAFAARHRGATARNMELIARFIRAAR